jgi:hypothetical protein
LRGSGSCPNFVLTGIATVVAAIVGEKLWASIKEFFEEDVVQEQSASVAWLAPAVVSMLCVRHMTTTGFHSYRAQSLVGLLGSVPRASAGVESIFEWTVKAIETVVNKIREWMSLPSVRLCTQYSKEVDSLLNRVDEFEKGELAPKESAERRYTRLKQLLCESYSLRSVYRHDREIQTGLNRHSGSKLGICEAEKLAWCWLWLHTAASQHCVVWSSWSRENYDDSEFGPGDM